jgi:hypothetical protein
MSFPTDPLTIPSLDSLSLPPINLPPLNLPLLSFPDESESQVSAEAKILNELPSLVHYFEYKSTVDDDFLRRMICTRNMEAMEKKITEEKILPDDLTPVERKRQTARYVMNELMKLIDKPYCGEFVIRLLELIRKSWLDDSLPIDEALDIDLDSPENKLEKAVHDALVARICDKIAAAEAAERSGNFVVDEENDTFLNATYNRVWVMIAYDIKNGYFKTIEESYAARELVIDYEIKHYTRRRIYPYEDNDEDEDNESGTESAAEDEPRITLHVTQSKLLQCNFSIIADQIINAMCPICTDTYASDNDVTITKCSHMFHTKCIRTWMSNTPNCPNCRTAL